jgi:hypothetical protein
MRRISCILLVLFVVAMIVPFSTASAYEGGLLNGKQMYFDTDYSMANGGYTLKSELTDNNNATHLDATSTRIAYLNLDNTYKITSYNLNYSKLTQDAYIWVHFYYKGKLIYQSSGLVNATLNFDVPILTDAVRIDIYNLRFNEVDIFGTVADVVPTNLVSQANDAKVDLTWTNASDISNYVIKRSQTPGGPYTTLGTVTSAAYSANYTDNSVLNGTTYYYIVTGQYSNVGTGNTNEVSATPQQYIPAPAGGLTATAGDSEVLLTWTESVDALSYNVKRATTAGGPYEVIATAIEGTTFVDTSVTNGTTYFYIVTAINSGESSNSNEASATPVNPTRALLTIYLLNGVEKEYDLSMTELNAFLAWYDAKDAGSGPARYAFMKSWNKGPFKSRTEYVIFDKILTFEVNEYEVDEQ